MYADMKMQILANPTATLATNGDQIEIEDCKMSTD